MSANDNDRLAKLRALLVECREKIGLTRDEIAELTEVSREWYRSFESGRPIRVSVPLLSRLSRTLQLKPLERLALYYLALPELYEAFVAQRASLLGQAV